MALIRTKAPSSTRCVVNGLTVVTPFPLPPSPPRKKKNYFPTSNNHGMKNMTLHPHPPPPSLQKNTRPLPSHSPTQCVHAPPPSRPRSPVSASLVDAVAREFGTPLRPPANSLHWKMTRTGSAPPRARPHPTIVVCARGCDEQAVARSQWRHQRRESW